MLSRSTGVSSSSRLLQRSPADVPRAPGSLGSYQEVLSRTCKGFPEAWATALQGALSGYLDSETQALDLRALPRGCLLAANDVLHAFVQACADLKRQPVELLLPPLQEVPDWVARCGQLRHITLSKFAGRRIDFTGLDHLSRLTLAGIPRGARPLRLHLQKGCVVEGQWANGHKAEWKGRALASHERWGLRPDKLNLNGQVTWSQTLAAQGRTEVSLPPDVSVEDPIACRHFALRMAQLWAEQAITGSEPVPLDSQDVIAREIEPELDAWGRQVAINPAKADLVAIDEWPQHMQAVIEAMQQGDVRYRCGVLVTLNHTLPFRVDRSRPKDPVIHCVDPNRMFAAHCAAPYAFNKLFRRQDPQTYLVDAPTQVLLPPDGELKRKVLTTQPATRSSHVLVVWLDNPLDLSSCIANGADRGAINLDHMGNTLTPALLSEFVRVGADARRLSEALSSCLHQGTTTRETLLELLASFSENHAPLLAEAFLHGHLHLVDVLGAALSEARKPSLNLLTDEDMFVCLTAAGGYSRSAMWAALDSEDPQALPSLGRLLLGLWKEEALSNATLHAILLSACREDKLSAGAIHRLTQLIERCAEQGALRDEEAASLRELLASLSRPKVKNRF